MNQADEDALAESVRNADGSLHYAIRLAIRAAVANERERAARVAKAWADDDMRTDDVDAAIRSGE